MESKKRGVFVKELNYKIDSFNGVLESFHPYIEKGFKFGYHSSEDTRELTNSKYPYQLSFDSRPTEAITILIRPGDLKKFDSANLTRGYLIYPNLKDTIVLEIHGENIKSGIIKVWWDVICENTLLPLFGAGLRPQVFETLSARIK